MKTNWIRPQSTRRAFTLVELIVVLMILVGLAAVLIPAITDMVSRTSRSTASSNISEVAGAIQRYEAQYMTYPNNFDGLVEDLLGEVLGSLNPGLAGNIEDLTLTAQLRAPLTAAGLTVIGVHGNNAGTFATPVLTALTDTSIVQALTTAHQVTLGLETGATAAAGKYVVLGVGPLCDMNGKTMLDAPVHFPRDPSTNPETVYSRFIAVFQITDGAAPLDRAKLVTVIAPDGSALSSEMDNYFEIASNN